MSRLEQMRQHFLQRVYCEQQQLSLSLSRSALSCAKSIQNIPSIMKITPMQNQLRRTPSCLQSTHGLKHRSEAPTRMKPKCASSKQQSEFTKGATVSDTSKANNNTTKVNNRPSSNGSSSNMRTLVTEPKRSTANSGTRDDELMCKHCARTFAAKERLDKHVEICAKTLHKQRPVFNSAKQRLTDHQLATEHQDVDRCAENQAPEGGTTSNIKEMAIKSSWKDSHRQFMEAIKMAKQCKSVKTTDVDDEIFKCCSYCKRTFGVNVIIRHESICGRLFRKKHFNI